MQRITGIIIVLTLLLSSVVYASEITGTFGVQQDSLFTNGYTIHSFGQYSSFDVDGKTAKVYPSYKYDQFVQLDTFSQSPTSNFWYDLVTSKGYTMSNVKIYENGVQILHTPNGTYGYLALDRYTNILAFTDTLPGDYVRFVLNHVE